MAEQSSDGILEEFRVEFLSYWRRLPNKGFFFVLLAGWVAMFQFFGNSTLGYLPTPSLLRWMYVVYQPGPDTAASDDAQGLIIPFLVLGLLWWKRQKLLSQPLREWWPALAIVGLGLVLHIIGFAAQQPRVSILGLFTGIYGLMGLAWGPNWLRASIFPCWLFVFAVPLGSLAEKVTFELRLLVCRLVDVICNNLFMLEIKRVGTTLMDPTGQYQYEVAAACSGLRSFKIIFLLATAYGFIAFKSNWKRLALMMSAFPLAVLGNLVRMLLIIFAAELGGQRWGSYVHESGWISIIPYVPAMAGLFGLGWLLEDRQLSALGRRISAMLGLGWVIERRKAVISEAAVK